MFLHMEQRYRTRIARLALRRFEFFSAAVFTRSIPHHDTLITTVLHASEAAEKDHARSALTPLLLAGDSQRCHPLPALRHGGKHPLEA